MTNETEANPLAADETAVPETEVTANVTATESETPAPDAEIQDGATEQAGETEAAETAADNDGASAEAEKPKKKNRVPAKDRIAELTRQKREAEARVAELEKKLSDAPQKPKREDFADEDDYQDARALYRQQLADRQSAEQQAKDATAQIDTAKAETWQAQQLEARERYQDFDAAINAVPGDVFNQTVADAILESDMAADVAYMLAKDLPRARQLAGMTPVQMGREIGRIEAELATSAKPKIVSKAPPPVQTVGTRGVPSGPDPSKMTPDEMVKYLGY